MSGTIFSLVLAKNQTKPEIMYVPLLCNLIKYLPAFLMQLSEVISFPYLQILD